MHTPRREQDMVAGNPLSGLVEHAPRLERISDYAHYYAARCPDRPATLLGERQLDYATLAAEVDRAANALIAAGVTRGDRVAMLTVPSPDFLILFLATSGIGAIWLGLNPKYMLRELEYVVRDAMPRIILAPRSIGERDYADELSRIGSTLGIRVALYEGTTFAGVAAWQDYLDRSAATPPEELDRRRARVTADDPCLLVYTSGSTGQPKGALLTHRGLVKGACRRAAAWSEGPMRTMANLPVNHIGGVGDICCTTLVTGGLLAFMARFDAVEAILLTQRHALTFWYQIPTQLRMIVDRPEFVAADLSSLKAVIWSGARAPHDLVATLAQRFPQRLGTDYSMTESIGAITMTPLGSDVALLTESVGWPDPAREVRLGDNDEILLRDDAMMQGYLGRPEDTARAIDQDGWLHTNDVGAWRPDGTLAIVGRLGDMFKSGGYNIYPKEIEQVLESHPSVAQAALVSAPDPVFSEIGLAYVSLKPGETADPQALDAWCRAHLANYKVPKRCTILPELPLLSIGKIDKQKLRQLP